MTASPVPAKFEPLFADAGIDPTFESIADDSGISVDSARNALTGADADARTLQRIADSLCVVPESLGELIRGE